MKSRFDISNEKHFDDYVKVRNLCYLVEQAGNDFYCDCYEEMKARYCYHSVGLMYKTEVLEVSSEVRSKPLGQKRKKEVTSLSIPGAHSLRSRILLIILLLQMSLWTSHCHQQEIPQLHLSLKQQEDLHKAIQSFPSSEIRRDQGDWRNFLICLLPSENPELKKLTLLTTILRNQLLGHQKE